MIQSLSQSMFIRISQEVCNRPLWGLFLSNEYLNGCQVHRALRERAMKQAKRSERYKTVWDLIERALSGEKLGELDPSLQNRVREFREIYQDKTKRYEFACNFKRERGFYSDSRRAVRGLTLSRVAQY